MNGSAGATSQLARGVHELRIAISLLSLNKVKDAMTMAETDVLIATVTGTTE
jgi:hypothetical protein